MLGWGRVRASTVALVCAAATLTFVETAVAAPGDWTLSKTANPTTYNAVGQVINYTYVITNVRGQNGRIVTPGLVDNKATILDCPINTPVPAAGITCHGTYTITAADIAAGSVTNIATVTGDSCNDGCSVTATASATVTLDARPSWTLTKSANPTSYTAAAQSIAYTYVLTNTGNVSISAISLTDNKVAPVSCPATTLAAGAFMTCTGNYSTTAADVSAGSVTNTATATGTPAGGSLAPVSAQATITRTPQPSWTLTKTANPTTYTAAGQTIAYTYVLTNTGNVSISAISLTDNKVAAVSCPATTLAIGANMTCTGNYTTTATDVSNGSVTNTATATGTPAAGSLAPVTAQATVTRTAQPSWTLTKTANPTSYSAAGQSIAYTYVLTNTGNVSISAISLTDNKVAAVNCPATTLAIGANMTCTGSYTTTATDVSNGSVTNTATATGTPAAGSLAPVIAQATITRTAQPSWTLTKTANPTTFTGAGQTIAYTYVLTNTGNVSISAISLTDNKVAAVSCPATTLAIGANMTCTGSYTTTASDFNNGTGSVTNTATATGTPAAGTLSPVTAQATVTARVVVGSITIVKLATGGDNTFNFTSSIGGAGSFTLTTSGGTATRTFTGLAPGTYTFAEGQQPLHWKLSALTCTGDAGGTPTIANVAAGSVSIGLDSGEAIVCTFTNTFDSARHIQETQTIIRQFLTHRINLLANDEPDRPRFLRRIPGSLWGEPDTNFSNGPPSSPFNFTGNTSLLGSQATFSTSLSQAHAYSEARANADALAALGSARKVATSPPSRFDAWAEVHFNDYTGDLRGPNTRGQFNVVYVGADYLLTNAILVGALVQFDWTSESSAALQSSVKGSGVMAGPYLSARLTPNLFFDVRGAWGVSNNNINPFGLYEDKFATDRWLMNARLTGNWWSGNFRITPSAGVTYIQENQHAYTDSLGVIIPAQTVALGRFTFGPEFAYRIIAANGTVYEPQIQIKGMWDFVKPGAATVGGYVVTNDDFRAQVQAGVMIRNPSGFSVRATALYDGIGSQNFRNYGGQFWVNLPLNAQ